MKYRSIILLLLFIPSHLTVTSQNKGSATSVFSFLQIPMSARLNSMGGNNVSILSTDLSLSRNNPALLSQTTHMLLNTNFAYLMENMYMANIVYGHNFNSKKQTDPASTINDAADVNCFAVGLHYINYGRMTYTDDYGNITGGTFTAHDMLIDITYSRKLLEVLRIGVALKHIYSAYERYSSLALGADVGLSYHLPDSSLQIGAVLQNIGWQLKKFYKDGLPLATLPLNLQMGLSYRLLHAPLRFSFTLHNLQRWKLDYEYTNIDYKDLQENPNMTKIKGIDMAFRHTIFCVEVLPRSEKFYLALSYNHRRRAELNLKDQKSLAGFAIGAGLKLRKFRLDLAFSQLVKKNITFQLGLTLDVKTLLK